MDCKFCKNTFKTTSILNNHMRTAVYCLDIQNKKNNEFSCSYCEKVFTTKNKMNLHENKCKDTYGAVNQMIIDLNQEIALLKQRLEDNKSQLRNKDDQIKELQNQLASIARTAASKSTHIHNNNQRINNIINNLIPITDDHLKEQAQFLTLEHIKNGPSGYARYALDYPLKDRVFCPDFSRKKINYKDSEGNLVNDLEMKKLCEKLFKSIEEQNNILTGEYLKELQEKLNELNNNPNNEMNEDEVLDFQQRSDDIIDYFFKYQRQMKEVRKASIGENSEIVQEFVKDVCSKTAS